MWIIEAALAYVLGRLIWKHWNVVWRWAGVVLVLAVILGMVLVATGTLFWFLFAK